MNLLEDMNDPLWDCKNVIYCYVNLIDSKKYVGQTSTKLKYRHYQHLRDKNRRKDYFHNAIKKYGIENFKLEILHIGDKYSLDLLEIYYIEKWNLLDNKYGYNLKTGGSSGKHTDNTKQKMSNYAKNRTEEHRLHLSESLKGEKNPHKGKTISDDNKQKMAEGRRNSEKRKQMFNTKVIQYDKDMNIIKIWDSISQVNKELKIDISCISKVCQGKRKTAGGYIWRYADK